MPPMDIIQATSEKDLFTASKIMTEVAEWLLKTGQPFWSLEELTPDHLVQYYQVDEFFLGVIREEPVAVMVLKWDDPLFWPEAKPGEAVYLHKFSIRNAYRGQQLSQKLLNWAVSYAAQNDRKYLRLDCDADRPKLNRIYQNFGFKPVDRRMVDEIYDTIFYQLNVTAFGN